MIQLDDRRFNRLLSLSVAAGFALLLTAFIVAVLTVRSNQSSSERVQHTYQVVEELATVEIQVERAETASRGFLLVPDPVRVLTYRDNAALVIPSIDRVARLSSDNPAQQRAVVLLRQRARDELASLDTIMTTAQSGRLDEARVVFGREVQRRRVNLIREAATAMRSAEERLLAERSEAEQSTASLLNWVLVLTGMLLFAVGALSYFLVHRYTADLTQTRDRLHLLNTDLEGAVGERTADLRRANEEIQRFAYIVSHDLRSPLVNIMGFTAELETAHKHLAGLIDRIEQDHPKLIDENARLAAKEDLPEAVGFIRASTQKMDRLINSILSLSRQGRRTLVPEHLPMDHLLDDIAASFEQQLGTSNSRLLITKPLPDLISDRIAIEQILSNLIENAIKYGIPDAAGVIVISGSVDRDRVSFDVTDNGRGIDPRDHERIFDLFRRSGKQDKPGEGLGLAHVRALAYRLGGTVDVQSTLGEGATFRLTLPATYRDQETMR